MVSAKQKPDESYLTDTLPILLPPIFDQVQHTLANHRKNLVNLRKIHETCSSITSPSKNGLVSPIGEKAFNSNFIDMVNRVLPVKKGVAQADRVSKFIASYIEHITAVETASLAADTTRDPDEEVNTPTTRFISKILKHLLEGMEAKDKNVRFRVTVLVVAMIKVLGEIDDDMYVTLRTCMLERARDKESIIRVQAAYGLAVLGDTEDDEESTQDVLLEMLQYDGAPEVRRAALANIVLTPSTLPIILARTRDIDPNMRRLVYHASLSSTNLPDCRALSLQQREQVVRNGLEDREATVRKAVVGMLVGWLDQVEGDVLKFLDVFDVVSNEVAEEALLRLFDSKEGVVDKLEFGNTYFEEMTAEKAFLVRVFADHCVAQKDEKRLEEEIPMLTTLATQIANEYEKLQSMEDKTVQAFIIGELLRLALNLDYADEIGRRTMFTNARGMLGDGDMPPELIPRCLDVLAKISDGEKDLIRVVVDIITEVREDDDDDPSDGASTYSATPVKPRAKVLDEEGKQRAAARDYRALLICNSLLERVNSTLQTNSVLHGLLPDLIIPAVQNKDEPALIDEGLTCLGLCCMIDSTMASNFFGLFIKYYEDYADLERKVRLARILFDLLMVNDIQQLIARTMALDQVSNLIQGLLESEDPEVEAIACIGTAKLMLVGMIQDEEVLEKLVELYFSPSTADNQQLRQCLSYFLPVYCYASPSNQRKMLSIFNAKTFNRLAEYAEEDEAHAVPLSQAGLMLVDWLNPEKAVEREGVQPDRSIHLDLGIEMLKIILTSESRDVRKALVSFLSKLNLPDQSDKANRLMFLLSAVRSKRPLPDAVSRNALTKFDGVLLKKYPELEGFDEEAFVTDDNDEIQALVKFADEVIPMEALPEAKSKRNSRAASRETSMAPTETESEVSEEETPAPKRIAKKMSVVEEEGSEEEVVDDLFEDDFI